MNEPQAFRFSDFSIKPFVPPTPMTFGEWVEKFGDWRPFPRMQMYYSKGAATRQANKLEGSLVVEVRISEKEPLESASRAVDSFYCFVNASVVNTCSISCSSNRRKLSHSLSV